MSETKAVWLEQYDWRNDKIYLTPCCPDCEEPSGGHLEWHILGDVLRVLNPAPLPLSDGSGICFVTMDGSFHKVDHWDLIIAHPPCTHLAVSGMRWFKEGKKPKYLWTFSSESAFVWNSKVINSDRKFY